MKKIVVVGSALCLMSALLCGCGAAATQSGSAAGSVVAGSAAEEEENSSLTQADWYEEIPHESWSQFEQVESPVEFFDVYKMPGDVYAIVNNGQWEDNVCYLVLGQEKAALVDTGMGLADIKTVVDSLTDLPVQVVLTHSHWDHIGGAYEFEDVWCYNNEACVRTVTEGIDHDTFAYELADGMIARPIDEDIDLDTYSIRPATVTGTLNDGDTIDLGSRELQVIYTPGHTADSICLLDKDNGLLFTGDTYYPDWLYAWCDDSDVTTYSQSMNKLMSAVDGLDIKWLYTGHNEVQEGTEVISEVAADLQTIVDGTATDYEIGDEGYRYYHFDNDIVIITLDEDVAK